MQYRSFALLAVALALPLAMAAPSGAHEPLSHRRPTILALPDRPTGLVIDARSFSLNRAMAPRILDEEGNVLYPNPRHVPEMRVLQEQGMVSYVRDSANAPRSGSEPLVVVALAVAGPARDDVVVSREAATAIRQANSHHGILDRWAVSFALGR
jgi:hypothetical protein